MRCIATPAGLTPFGMPYWASGVGSSDHRLEVGIRWQSRSCRSSRSSAVTGRPRTTNTSAQQLDIDANPPEGLIAQTAGWDEQGGVFRLVAIWNNADEAKSFMRDRLRP